MVLSTALWVFISTMLHLTGVSISSCGPTLQCQQLNGTINGGRCFFLTSTNLSRDWNTSWSTCRQYGGVLAQIHTQSEYNDITAMVKTLYNNSINSTHAVYYQIAMKHDFDGSVACAVAKNKSYWYDNETTQTPLMTMANSWIKSHVCDENDNATQEFCYFFYIIPNNNGLTDGLCLRNALILCQFDIQSQDYHKTNICMTEPPVMTIPVSTLQDCADTCSAKIWCRSYNFMTDMNSCSNHTCLLFSRSVLDPCSKCPSTIPAPADQSCVHFNYVP